MLFISRLVQYNWLECFLYIVPLQWNQSSAFSLVNFVTLTIAQFVFPSEQTVLVMIFCFEFPVIYEWTTCLHDCSPTNPALLGLNVGAGIHVKLRLRRPNRELDFYPFDQVLDTMLHELCHNAHGPHNASFYKLWDELRKVSLLPMILLLTMINGHISFLTFWNIHFFRQLPWGLYVGIICVFHFFHLYFLITIFWFRS